MATSREENPDLVDQFVAVTGATRAIAISMLEACAGNLDLAVGMHMDGHGVAGGSSGSVPDDGATASGAGPVDLEDEDDGIRAPIPQKTEVLVEDDGFKFASWRMRRPRRMVRSVFDGFRDFQAEAKNYEAKDDSKSSSKKRNLEDLFRPPVDITHKGTFQSARDFGSSHNQWILVNVQNVQEFECQVLNRDVWSYQAAKKLITKNFVFWQVYNDSAEGKRFMQFYKVSQWPYVAIIDPFTGENQVTWHKLSDGQTFCELANDFLSVHPVPNKCDSDSDTPPSAKRTKREPSIVDASEQDQMEAAIQASLRDSQAKSQSPHYIIDSDSEPDLMEDSAQDETFSDSDNVIVSSPTKEKSSSQNRFSKIQSLCAATSTSPSSSSSWSSTSSSTCSSSLLSHQSTSKASNKLATATNSHNNKSYKTKCNHLSTSTKTTCSYSPLSLDPEDCGASTTISSLWDSTGASLIDSPLGVNTDNSLSETIGGRDGEVCTVSSSPCSSHTSDVPGQTDVAAAQELDWKQYWGQATDAMSKIMIRFPDNRREQLELPCSSSLKALKVYCASCGFAEDKYELVTNFPRRKLSEMEETKTLKDAGLHPQDTVFIQDL